MAESKEKPFTQDERDRKLQALYANMKPDDRYPYEVIRDSYDGDTDAYLRAMATSSEVTTDEKEPQKEKKTLNIKQFKLACISDEELTDEQVNVLMRMVVLESEEDVLEFCAILHKYRPALEKKFAAELLKKE